MRLEIDNADLQQVVKQVVERVIFRLDELQLSDSKRLAYTEPEAAAALGIKLSATCCATHGCEARFRRHAPGVVFCMPRIR